MNGIWSWLKDHDLPNWVNFALTLIVWPLVLFYWNNRKVNSIPNLEVSLAPSTIHINQSPYQAVDFNFKNNTGKIVYLTNPKISKASKSFPIPTAAARGIGKNSYELLFIDKNNHYTLTQIILQTAQMAKTSIAVDQQLPNTFYLYSPHCARKLISWSKYFKIEYIAMVGGKRYRVSMVY